MSIPSGRLHLRSDGAKFEHVSESHGPQTGAYLEELLRGFPERTEMEHGSPALCVKLFRTRLPAAGNALCSRTMIRSAIKYRRAHVTPVIHIDAKRQSAQWIFAVTDNGIGIDPVCKERIFGLFKRLHDNDTYWGTGIGLALSQRIVEHYHGRIRVESEPGIGWKFHFTLPV